MIRVFIVDDSPTAQQCIAHLLSSDKDIEIVGFADSGEEAIEKIESCKPDLVTMDIIMAGMDGIKTTRAILERYPVPIVIVSSCYNPDEVELSYRAIEAGALAILPKPTVIGTVVNSVDKEFVRTIKVMAEVKVIKRRKTKLESPVKCFYPFNGSYQRGVKIVAIGASTGGPPVLQTLLGGLPADFPVPIVVVQHISPGFIDGMVRWLQPFCKLSVKVAEDKEGIKPGNIYFAPDKKHMGIDRKGCVFLSDAPTEHGVRPSVSFLFRSVVETYGGDAIGILLTGMGQDGADEMLKMHQNRAITMAQNQESCVIFGMPGEAVRLGGVTHVLSPEQIINKLLLYCGGNMKQASASSNGRS